MANGNGERKKSAVWDRLIVGLIATIIGGGAGFGTLKIVDSDTLSRVNSVEKKQAVLETQIEGFKTLSEVKNAYNEKSVGEIKRSVEELKKDLESFKKEQRKTNQSMMRLLEQILLESKNK